MNEAKTFMMLHLNIWREIFIQSQIERLKNIFLKDLGLRISMQLQNKFGSIVMGCELNEKEK